MSKTKMQELAELGQSIWLDYIDREIVEGGKLQKMIDLGLRGMTSNPTIFHQAISKSTDYDESIAQLKDAGKSTFEIYDELTIKDIQDAAGLFKPVYEGTNRLDGYVSLEINPQLAHDTQSSIEEGKRLFEKVNRPNCMIKVPATDAGFPVIEELLGSGINVNVTLIFSRDQYLKTVDAYFRGMQALRKNGIDLNTVRSVASVFVSRVDTAVDKLLEEKEAQAKDDAEKSKLQALKGKAAVANSKAIFALSQEMFSGDKFKTLQQDRAEVQRVLWGSTGTKNPNYSDIKYVTELIGNPTVNTLPEKTINAFLDHGVAVDSISQNAGEAVQIIDDLKSVGIDVDEVCLKLLDAGVSAFETSFESLLEAIETKAQQLCTH